MVIFDIATTRAGLNLRNLIPVVGIKSPALSRPEFMDFKFCDFVPKAAVFELSIYPTLEDLGRHPSNTVL